MLGITPNRKRKNATDSVQYATIVLPFSNVWLQAVYCAITVDLST